MTLPLLLDLSHTSHSRARTGVQRVARALWRELGENALPVCFDPHWRAWRPLENWERSNLTAHAPGKGRGAKWPLRAKLRGFVRQKVGSAPALPHSSAFLTPEIFSPKVASALPSLGAPGPRAALFHDAIALRYPELTPVGTVGRFPAYLQDLLAFDGIAAVSEDSKAALVDYWAWLGVRSAPPVVAIPLGVDSPPPQVPPPPSASGPTVLCVGSIEGRKNHVSLVEACERLWTRGVRFELRLIGLAQSATGQAALDSMSRLVRAGRPLHYDGALSDSALEEAYAAASFTVYPSIAEGFGLPVAESVARGKPCVCSAFGPCGEIAKGGGCLALDSVDIDHLEAGIGRLLAQPAELALLAKAARARPVRTWAQYASEIDTWIKSLVRRS